MIANDSRLPVRRLLCACTLAVFIVPVTPISSHAAVYKCVSADGSTTYNDTPCAADESTRSLSKSARVLTVLDCRIARNFVIDAVARMRQKDSAQDVFQAYGGADTLSSGARILIDSVFSFENDPLISAQRIVDITVKRCQTGLLSQSLEQCETFPGEFIQRSGGCIKARENDQTILIQPPKTDRLSRASTAAQPKAQEPSLNAAQPLRGNDSAD